MMHLKTLTAVALVATLFSACRSDVAVPTDAVLTDDAGAIYPDYRNITIPSNIAPLNFRVTSDADEYVVAVKGKKGEVTASAQTGEPLQFDTTAWHTLLADNQGTDLTVTLYSHRDGQWLQHPDYKLTVAEPIDRYLSYRLIEPSYELYRQVGLYQRDLTNFEQRAIYENNSTYDSIDNHCVNCHNYQNYDTKRMLFHVRAGHGGTVIAENGKAKKWNMKADSVLSSTVYPSWHPTRNWVVFSSNQTGQAFHIDDRQKIEVVDYGSDLVFFDADAGTLTNILKTDEDLETFPCWAPDGKKLYYCSAHVPQFAGLDSKQREDYIMAIHDSLHYNVMSMTFDETTRTFGPPTVEVDCASMKKSASVPRVSPDGRYVLFTLGDYGQFHIWHTSADLYVKDLTTGEVRALDAANSPAAESYHTWSSNGRWMVFVSRRDDGSFSRPYIAYFGADGKDRKAFIVPQENPQQNVLLMKSYNVPELTKSAVSVSAEEFRSVIYSTDEPAKVTYKAQP